MTIPREYVDASKDFDRFILDVRDTCMLSTHHQAYHTLRAVLHVFRAHLEVADALRFADVLPPVVRAIYVEDRVPAPPSPFPDPVTLQAEVWAVRANHNVAPVTAIADVAAALRRAVDPHDFDRCLGGLPAGAAAYWAASDP
jgi:uncharacterized protein (DUF2267 family)